MTFAHPWVLALGAVILAAAAYAALKVEPRSPTLLYPENAVLRSRADRAAWARKLPLAVRTAALLLVCLGLARPQRLRQRAQAEGLGIDIIIALDTSMSMNALDFDPMDRLAAAKDAATRFIRGRVQDRIGLVVFGGSPLLACPLTLDYDALLGRVAELSAGMTNADGTALGDGLLSAVNRMRASAAKSKVIILLTDGRGNVGLDAVTAAKTAAAVGVKVYAIGTAQRGESVMPVDDPRLGRVMVRIQEDLDEDTLMEVARLTDGKYWRATSLKELRGVYAEIDRLEKSSVKLPETVSRDDLYRGPVLAASLLLLLEMALTQALWLRWP
ncbi:MAG: VWA domain-containing protein [Elusimicrobiota bacterium]